MPSVRAQEREEADEEKKREESHDCVRGREVRACGRDL
jgi:hypothetical protein